MSLLTTLNPYPYHERILATRPENLVAYWPLWDEAGTIARNLSKAGAAHNGATSGALIGAVGAGDDFTSYSFDGTNDFVNIYTAALAGAFNGQELTISAWFKASGSGIWTDAANREVCRIAVDANNDIAILKSSTNNRLTFFYRAGGTSELVNLDGVSPTTWVHLALTASLSGDAMKAYYVGAQTGSTQTGLGTWSGALASTTCTLGAISTAGASPWSGYIAHVAVWSTPLTAAEIASIARLPRV